MDGVSVASGVAGLITLALQVSGTIAIYANAIKERPRNIQELHEELLLLGKVLNSLRDFLAGETAKGRAWDENSVLQRALGECRNRIERIGERLRPAEGGRVSRTFDKLKWPLEQKEVMHMTENLRRFTQTFQFAVSIEGCALLSKASDDATTGLQEMLRVSQQISHLSAQMRLSAEEAAKRALQLEQILSLVPMLSLTSSEISRLSQAAQLSELWE